MTYQAVAVAGLLAFMPATGVMAHQVKVAGTVGATLHIEPNDIPKAGAPSEVWFALTQPGGVVIPLEACDCSLTVYDTRDTAISRPPLTPTSAEGYADIPGALVTFPEVGTYELVLAGQPQQGASFEAFELRFDVIVAARAAGAASPAINAETASAPEDIESDIPAAKAETPQSAPSSFQGRQVLPWLGAALGGLVLLGILSRFRSSGEKS